MATSPRDKTEKEEEKKPINLLRGWPSPSLLPVAQLRTATQRALADPTIYEPGLQYGPDPGYEPLREALATWLSEFYTFPSASPSPSLDADGDGAKMSQYSHPPDAARIAITGGASQSVAVLLQGFTDAAPGATRAVWIAAPCYFLGCPIFADAGFAPRDRRLRAVPEDDEGIDVVALERGMRELEELDEEEGEEEVEEDQGSNGGARRRRRRAPAGVKDPGPLRKIYRHVVYCVPSFSNPSGKTMSLARREALVRLAREFDALVICDDVYDHLQWRILDDAAAAHPPTTTTAATAPPPARLRTALLPRLLDIDLSLGRSAHDPPGRGPFGHVVSNGTFSKLSGPGVRTGWTESTAAFAAGVAAIGSSHSGGAPSQLTATFVHQLLASGDLARHLAHVLRPAYQRRHAVLLAAVRRLLVPLGARVCAADGTPVPDAQQQGEGEEAVLRVYGGFFLWITFAETTPAADGGGAGRKVPPAATIAARCLRDENLTVGAGHLFEVHGDEAAVRFARDLRLCFAWEDEPDLVDGVERLARVVRRLVDEGEAAWDVDVGEGAADVGGMK